jgi:hypothetical protein
MIHIDNTLISMTILQRMMILGIVVNLARIPPIAGHMRNAKPNAAPMRPIRFAFSLGAEISEIYACITQNQAPQSHHINREIRNNPKIGVNPSKILVI